MNQIIIRDKFEHLYQDLLIYKKIGGGLCGGSLGIALYYAYLYYINPSDELQEALLAEIEKAIGYYTSDSSDSSLGYGITGLLWVLDEMEHLQILSFSEADKVMTDRFEQIIIKSFEEDRDSGNYDHLSGLIGKGVYFLRKADKEPYRGLLHGILQHLSDMSVKDGPGVLWKTINQDKQEIDTGLAHGMPGIIFFLVKLHGNGINAGLSEELIRKAITWLLERGEEIDNAYAFPYKMDITGEYHQKLRGRLAWCYGDLGIAYVLISAGKQLNDSNYYEFGIRIASNMARRSDPMECGIRDASLCHGTAGVAILFAQIFESTLIEEFKVVSDAWYAKTIESLKFDDGIGGYKYWDAECPEVDKYQSVAGFLEGASGIGISLLTYERPDMMFSTSWEQLLLLK